MRLMSCFGRRPPGTQNDDYALTLSQDGALPLGDARIAGGDVVGPIMV